MITRQFEELKQTGRLPTPTGVGMRILCLVQDSSCSIEALSAVIQTDPSLTLRIIKLASSAAGAGRSIATTHEAAVRLGLRAVANVALGFSLVTNNRDGSSTRFDYDAYWANSLARAVACQVISKRLGQGVSEELFTLGLLSRVGDLALAAVYPDVYDQMLATLEEGGQRERASLEEQQFGMSSREASVGLLADWGLPLYFGQSLESLAVRDDGEGLGDTQVGTATNVLALAFAFADFCVATDEGLSASAGLVFQLGTLFGFKPEGLEEIRLAIAEQWREWGEMLKIPTRAVPMLDAADAILPNLHNGARAARGIRILAADDDPVALRLLEKHLVKAGHKVVTAKNGMEALGKALETNPQMIVTDWMMPEMDGLRFTKALRCYPQGRRMYVLLLTGQSEEDRTIEAFEAGVDDYIVKPFKPRLLLARIRAGIRVLLLQEQLEKKNEMLREWARKDREAAMTDALTELPNRRYALRVLDTEWSKADRTGAPLSLIMIDIDFFKSINDNHGHDAGDKVLHSVSRVLADTVRTIDVVARVGGEEFLVVCPNTDAEAAVQVAERLRSAVDAHRIEFGTFAGSVTVSLGVAVHAGSVPNKDALLKLADKAVYEAKNGGRNRVVVSRADELKRSA